MQTLSSTKQYTLVKLLHNQRLLWHRVGARYFYNETFSDQPGDG